MNEQKPFRTADAVAEIMQRGPENRKRHFRRSFLLAVRRSLFKLRQEAGKTQAQIAEALGTTQSAIARLEKIDPANITLGRLVDYALACDAAPLDLSFVSVQQLTDYTVARPEQLRTADVFESWRTRSCGSAFIPQRSQAHLLPRSMVHPRPVANVRAQSFLSGGAWPNPLTPSNGKEQTITLNYEEVGLPINAPPPAAGAALAS